ncbi:MAG: amidase [Acidimicrobiales bacterium]
MLNSADLEAMDATEMGLRLVARDLRSEELVAAHLELIEERNPAINAFALRRPGESLMRAREMDDELRRGVRRSPVHGVPFTVKDSLDTAGWRTSRGSRVFASRVPEVDATAVRRLIEGGGVLLGKTNVPEFSLWTETDNDLVGRTNNPLDLTRTPGGSSGGESAAIASGMSPMGLGSDVAISVRGPAHCTGIAALKPTRSRSPLTGHWPAVPAKSWHIGPMARSVRDLVVMFDLLQGRDEVDPVATTPRAGRRSGAVTTPLRIGWATSPAFGPVSQEVVREVERAAEVLAEGASVELASQLDRLSDLDAAWVSTTLLRDAIAPLVRGFRDVVTELSPRIRSLALADPPTAVQLQEAQNSLMMLSATLDEFFVSHDVLLCPVCPSVAPPHGQAHLDIDDTSVSAPGVMRATASFNLTGHPAVSVPFGRSDSGLPINVQVVARRGHDEVALAVAGLLERRRVG